MLIGADLLFGRRAWLPDHWIGFLGDLDISREHVRFDCYTWGGFRRVDVSRSRFNAGTFGLVTGAL